MSVNVESELVFKGRNEIEKRLSTEKPLIRFKDFLL